MSRGKPTGSGGEARRQGAPLAGGFSPSLRLTCGPAKRHYDDDEDNAWKNLLIVAETGQRARGSFYVINGLGCFGKPASKFSRLLADRRSLQIKPAPSPLLLSPRLCVCVVEVGGQRYLFVLKLD